MAIGAAMRLTTFSKLVRPLYVAVFSPLFCSTHPPIARKIKGFRSAHARLIRRFAVSVKDPVGAGVGSDSAAACGIYTSI
jgi:hypothetical protein